MPNNEFVSSKPGTTDSDRRLVEDVFQEGGLERISGHEEKMISYRNQIEQGLKVNHIELVNYLIEVGEAWVVVQSMDDFMPGSIDQRAVVEALIDDDPEPFAILADHLEKFEPGSVDHSMVAQNLLEDGDVRAIVDNLEKFEPGSVDTAMLARMVIDKQTGASYGDSNYRLLDNLRAKIDFSDVVRLEKVLDAIIKQ